MADKPNILIIWGDDIGQSNLSCYSDGVMGYRTNNIDRIASEGARFTDYYGEQSCTAGRAAFITGQNPYRTGLTKVGLPGAAAGPAGRGPDDRDRTEGAGLRHRPVRQEPPRRPRRAPADHARLRRVLRQPVPPQRRGGTRERRLPEGPGVPQEVRAARRPAHLGQRRRHPAHRGHRPADQEADGDLRRRIPRRRSRFHQAPARGATRRSSSGSTRRTCTSAPTPSRRASAGPGAGSPSTTTPCSITTTSSATC